jgi:alpha-mannosidase
MNNYWFTNFRAFQDGEFRWSYYLTSTRDSSNTAATGFGWGSRIPLVARVLTAGASQSGKSSLSTLQISAPNVALVGARPARDGNGIILHLRELEGKATRVRLTAAAPAMAIQSITETNLFEERLKPASAEIEFSPFEVKFIKLQFR